jgi:hypothetical protein
MKTVEEAIATTFVSYNGDSIAEIEKVTQHLHDLYARYQQIAEEALLHPHVRRWMACLAADVLAGKCDIIDAFATMYANGLITGVEMEKREV